MAIDKKITLFSLFFLTVFLFFPTKIFAATYGINLWCCCASSTCATGTYDLDTTNVTNVNYDSDIFDDSGFIRITGPSGAIQDHWTVGVCFGHIPTGDITTWFTFDGVGIYNIQVNYINNCGGSMGGWHNFTVTTCIPSCPGGCANVGQFDGCSGFCPNSAGNVCDDGNICTSSDVCGGGICVGTNNTNPCDDSNLCTSSDTCSGGSCTGSAITCDDSNICTNDSCIPISGCNFANNTNPCDDSNFCTSSDTCSGGSCIGSAVTCNDSNACTDDSCIPASGCAFTNNSNPCNDSKSCTSPDICSGGICVGAVNCATPPNTQCYAVSGFCDALFNCAYNTQPNDTPCDDGEFCTAPDLCESGVCVSGGAACGGIVPCGRSANNPVTTYDETEPCTLCHIFIMLQMVVTFVVEMGGIIAAFFLIIGGLIYSTSAGDQGRVETGKKAIMWALYGLAIIFLAWLVVTIVLVAFGYVNPLGGQWNIVSCSV